MTQNAQSGSTTKASAAADLQLKSKMTLIYHSIADTMGKLHPAQCKNRSRTMQHDSCVPKFLFFANHIPAAFQGGGYNNANILKIYEYLF